MVLSMSRVTIAVGGMLMSSSASNSQLGVDQLEGALKSRIVIEQAKGMLAQHHRITVDEAFNLLRTHALSHNRRMTDIAQSIVIGERSELDNLTT